MPLSELASKITVNLIVALIRTYQRYISPYTGTCCRFYPSCSEYSSLSFKKYGFFVGMYKTFLRVAKCHPYHPGGYDPVR